MSASVSAIVVNPAVPWQSERSLVEPPLDSNAAAADDLAFLKRATRPDFEHGAGPLSIVDLFSGCGGMTLGFAHAAHRAGFGIEAPLAIDLDPHAVAVFKKNFPTAN